MDVNKALAMNKRFLNFFPQGNLKEEIKQLQEAEEQMKNRVTELTQKKETFKVRELPPYFPIRHACFWVNCLELGLQL